MDDRRIYLIGQEFSLYISRLYDKIAEKTNEFTFSSEWHASMSGSNIYVESRSINKIEVADTYSAFKKIISLSRILFIPAFWREVFYAVRMNQVKGLRSLYSYTMAFHILPQIIRKSIIDKQNFSSFHFHYLHPNNLRLLDYLPQKSNVICTFWGSDIFLQDSDWENYHVAKALKKAQVITVTTKEMANAVLEKYGEDLKQKIRYCTFILDESLFRLIENFTTNASLKDDFRDKFKIPKEKVVISIGNNGRLANNHMQVIEQLCMLDEKVRQNIFIIIPLTYGIEQPGYAEMLGDALKDGGFQFMVLRDFLSLEELAGFRSVTDIYIHVPGDDALSGTAIEYMYGGNILVTGSWLPYSYFRDIRLNYFVIDDIPRITHTINDILLNLAAQKNLVKNNTAIIKRHIHPDSVVSGWIDSYRLLGGKQL